MTVCFFTPGDGCRLAYEDVGSGLPVLWQHGLGADRGQPTEVFPHRPGLRRLTLECRGHGLSNLGDATHLSIVQFTTDALALLDHLGLDRAVVGGISLGAAIALRLATNYPERVRALILARPAWIDETGPDHLRIYSDVADLMAAHGVAEGRRRFEASPRLAEIEAISPDNAASLRYFFERPRPDTTIALLREIPAQGIGIARSEIETLAMPTLVIGNAQDYVHTLGMAKALADLIPGAAFAEITSKSISRDRYVGSFREAIATFLATVPGPS